MTGSEGFDDCGGLWRLPKLAPVVAAAGAGIGVAEGWWNVAPLYWCFGLSVVVLVFGCWPCRLVLLGAVGFAFALAHSLDHAARGCFPLSETLEAGRRVEVTIVGVVVDAPVAGEGGERFSLRTERVWADGGVWETRAEVLVRGRHFDGVGSTPVCGDRLEVKGWLSAPASPRNPGEFDAVTWFRREGWVGEVKLVSCRLLEQAAVFPIKRWALRVRAELAGVIITDLDPVSVEAIMIKTMVLGGREPGIADLEETFLHAGTLHIFSVSGLHVGLVAILLWRVLNLLRLSRRPAAWVSVPFVLFYALLTGWQPAAVRSAFMASVVLVGIGLDRPARFFNSLCLAAVLVLATDTHQLFQVGTQLSFVVIAVIAAGSSPVVRGMDGWVRPDPFLPQALWSRSWRLSRVVWRWFSKSSGVSFVAVLGSSPLTLWHFQVVTPVSLVANMVHVPLAGLVLASAGISAIVQPCSRPVASCVCHANWAFARTCLVTGQWFASVPGGSLVWNPRLPADRAGSCRITVFDLGGGGAVLIRTPGGCRWLIDTGRPGAFRSVVSPGLAWNGVRRLHGMILSHGDHDHVGGAPEAMTRYQPKMVGHPSGPSRSPAMRSAIQLGAAVARPLASGDSIALEEGVVLTVLWPPPGQAVPLADDGCLVLLLECAGRTILFGNDSGFLAERALLLAHPQLPVDIWIRGEHSSDLSAQPEFVAALQPSLIVSACRSGSPAVPMDAARRGALEATGARVLEQARCGAVEIVLQADGSWSERAFLE